MQTVLSFILLSNSCRVIKNGYYKNSHCHVGVERSIVVSIKPAHFAIIYIQFHSTK